MTDQEVQVYVPLVGEPKSHQNLQDHRFVRIQANLIRAIAHLSCCLGQSLARHSPTLKGINEEQLPFSIDDGDAIEAIECLFDIIHLAWDQDKKSLQSPFAIGATEDREPKIGNLQLRLLILILTLLPQGQDPFTGRLAKCAPLVSRIPDNFKGTKRPSLTLETIQWLEEVAWYSLRYWVPRYPTTAELACELSLAAEIGEAKIRELQQDAECLAPADAIHEVRSALQVCEADSEKGLSPASLAFYVSIVALIQHQMDVYRASASRWGEEGEKWRDYPYPIVLTTNFDRCIESILQEQGLSYNVLFPVITDQIEENGGWQARDWTLRTYYSRTEAAARGMFFSDYCGVDLNYTKEFADRFLVGPLIVKLHGSPMEALGPTDREHRLVLSEGDYVQAMNDLRTMPRWVQDQLYAWRNREHRSTWYLGYSFSDWNIRNQFTNLPGPSNMIALSTDPSRSAFLARLNVTQHLGDLADFPRMVSRIMKFEPDSVSDKVEGILGKLRELI